MAHTNILSNAPGSIIYWNGTSSATTTSTTNAWTNNTFSTTATGTQVPSFPAGTPTQAALAQLAQQNAALQQQVLQQQVLQQQAGGGVQWADLPAYGQPPNFNEYVNASDLLKDFIKFLGEIGVNQKQFLDLPIELFINWLVIMAAKADGEAPPDDVRVKDHPRLPAPYYGTKCRACGRFVGEAKAKEGLPFCGPDHVLIFMDRRGITDGK